MNIPPVKPDLAYPATIGAALGTAVDKWGDRDFIVMPDARMTFAQAEAASRRLGKELVAAGLGKGSRIGIFDTYSLEWVVAWLAVARIGALAMPFASTYRPAELRTVFRIGDVDTLLVAPTMFGRDVTDLIEQAVPALAGRPTDVPFYFEDLPYLRRVMAWGDTDKAWATSLRIDVGADGAGPVPDAVFDALEAEVTPADLAQVTYTSGSSAQPKGVVHSHGAIINSTGSVMGRIAGFGGPLPDEPTEPTVAFNAFPFFWIGGTLILGRSLNHGTTQCCLPRFEPEAGLDLIERERCTSITGWPSLVQAMRGDRSFAGRDLSFIPALAPEAPGPIPTGPGGLQGHRSMSELVGNWAGSERKVIDPETGATLGELEEGELCVRGWGALQGYYKKEREDTFDSDGWLHTGDRVAMADNRVFFVGRFYEMIKAGGANVSPLEVESAVEAWPEIKHCFVFSTPLEGQIDAKDEEVCAAIVFMPGVSMTIDDIQARARGELSSYKVPTRIEIVTDEDNLPWLASGKPDKRTLRDRLIEG